MATVQYRGRAPDSDASLVTRGWVDTAWAAQIVTNTYVNAVIANEITNNSLQLFSYVDAQDNLLAHKAAVDAADALYLPTSALGAVNGVASLGSTGALVPAQLPSGLVTERLSASYDFATYGTRSIPIGTNNGHTVTSASVREYEVASITVPDPGFPWRALPFGSIVGYSTSAGGNTAGKVSVMAPSGVSDIVYGVGVCTSQPEPSFFPIIPTAAASVTPLTQPALVGSYTLKLYACCSGGSYFFLGDGLAFHILVLPAM